MEENVKKKKYIYIYICYNCTHMCNWHFAIHLKLTQHCNHLYFNLKMFKKDNRINSEESWVALEVFYISTFFSDIKKKKNKD